jgi:hypothetical protein
LSKGRQLGSDMLSPHRVDIPRCVGCRRGTWRACHAQREQAGYSQPEVDERIG